MADGFEPYHVPQQIRRDKLRVVEGSAALLPLYDSALISSDLLTCDDTGAAHEFHPHNNPIGDSKGNAESGVKEDAGYLLSYVHNHYLDMNHSSIQGLTTDPFVYNPQNLHSIRDFDHSYHGDELVIFKPEPLSLSLSSSQRSHQNSVPLELNLQSYCSAMYRNKDSGGYVVPSIISGSGSSNDLSVPLGPFSGYASILKGSRFLKPAQQLLDELCDVGRGISADRVSGSLMDASMEGLGGDGIGDDQVANGDGGEHRRNKSRLLSLLNEVYRRYKQYYQQMQEVIASFEYVAGLGNAAPYANLALKTMSKHFRCLKNVISDQLWFTNKAQGHTSNRKDEDPKFGNSDIRRLANNSGFLEHQPVWRPQRGLPERAITVLRAWLFEHFLHP